MLTIRLSRTGKKHAPQYRIVLQEKGRDPWSPAIEILGHYNPRTNPSEVKLEVERIKEWLAKGAQPSNTVHNLLINEGVIKGEKAKSVTISNKRKAKLEEKKAEAAEKVAEAKAKAEEAKQAEEAEAKAAKEEVREEAPVEEKTEEAPKETPVEEKPEEVKEETKKEAAEEKKEEVASEASNPEEAK